jgi:putative phage-type endonuclease
MTQVLSRHGIGASEIAAVCGMNPYASPWDVWLRKTGQTPDVEQNEPMEWGHRLEPAIRQKYADETGQLVRVPGESMFSAERPWARATPDGIVLNMSKHAEHLLQCKNVGFFVGRDWEGGPPAYVQLQEQWELCVTGLERADVAVLIGGSDYRTFTVHRDNRMIADLLTIADEFWRRVETKTPPKVDESEACARHIQSKLKRTSINLPADEEATRLLEEWRTLAARLKHDERRIKTIRAHLSETLVGAQADRIVSELGTAQLQKTGGGTEINWRLIAELLGSTKCSNDEFRALVEANTKTEPEKLTLYAPRSWAKDAI